MTDFTREWIAKREQLEQAATEGPWYAIDGIDWVARVGGGGLEVADTGKVPDAEFIADARTSLPAALAALKAVLTFAAAERDKIRSTYAMQPGTAYAGYADAMDDVICTIEDALRGES